MIEEKFYYSNNYVKNNEHLTVYIADSVRDAQKIAELMNLIPGYEPETERQKRVKHANERGNEE